MVLVLLVALYLFLKLTCNFCEQIRYKRKSTFKKVQGILHLRVFSAWEHRFESRRVRVEEPES
jgi:hypothetical protein